MTEALSEEFAMAVITCRVDVGLSVEDCWNSIGSFADAGRFLDVPSRLVSGEGGIGSVRQIGDAILEVMVGQSDASYTYLQTQGPMAASLYHGCVALMPTGLANCTLTYTITYNQAPMDPARRDAERARIRDRFHGAAKAMRRAAEQGHRL